jgi:hypothetical protein
MSKEQQDIERLLSSVAFLQNAVIEMGSDIERLKRDRKDIWTILGEKQ